MTEPAAESAPTWPRTALKCVVLIALAAALGVVGWIRGGHTPGFTPAFIEGPFCSSPLTASFAATIRVDASFRPVEVSVTSVATVPATMWEAETLLGAEGSATQRRAARSCLFGDTGGTLAATRTGTTAMITQSERYNPQTLLISTIRSAGLKLTAYGPEGYFPTALFNSPGVKVSLRIVTKAAHGPVLASPSPDTEQADSAAWTWTVSTATPTDGNPYLDARVQSITGVAPTVSPDSTGVGMPDIRVRVPLRLSAVASVWANTLPPGPRILPGFASSPRVSWSALWGWIEVVLELLVGVVLLARVRNWSLAWPTALLVSGIGILLPIFLFAPGPDRLGGLATRACVTIGLSGAALVGLTALTRTPRPWWRGLRCALVGAVLLLAASLALRYGAHAGGVTYHSASLIVVAFTVLLTMAFAWAAALEISVIADLAAVHLESPSEEVITGSGEAADAAAGDRLGAFGRLAAGPHPGRRLRIALLSGVVLVTAYEFGTAIGWSQTSGPTSDGYQPFAEVAERIEALLLTVPYVPAALLSVLIAAVLVLAVCQRPDWTVGGQVAAAGYAWGLVAGPQNLTSFGGLQVGSVAIAVAVAVTIRLSRRSGPLPPKEPGRVRRTLFVAAALSAVPVFYFLAQTLSDLPDATRRAGAAFVGAAFVHELARWLVTAWLYGELRARLPAAPGPVKAMCLVGAWFAAAGLVEIINLWGGREATRVWVFPGLQILLFMTVLAVIDDYLTVRADTDPEPSWADAWSAVQTNYHLEGAKKVALAVVPLAATILALGQQVVSGSGAAFVSALLQGITPSGH